MKPNRSRTLSIARLVPIVTLALASLLAFPTPAQALGDYVGAEAAPWLQTLSGNASIDNGSVQGTRIDFRSDLGLDDRDTTPQGRVWFRWGKNRLIFDYAGSSHSGDGQFTQSTNFNGTTYTTTEAIASKYDLNLYEGQYRHSFLDLKLVEVGLGLGANIAQIRMNLQGSTTGTTRFDQNIPYPTVNATVVLKPIPGFHIRAEANGLSVNVSGNKVTFLDARVQLESYFFHAFGIFGGYRTYRFTADSSDYGHVENTFKGPYIGLGVKF